MGRRDREIEAFQPKPSYEVIAHLVTPDGSRFTAKWQPSEACRPYQDEDGRVLSRPLAENVANRITDKTALLSKLEQKEKQQAAPLPYSLSSLQIDAAKRFGMSAQQVLDGCQALYEKHKLITYPRSDSRYLPVEQHAQAPSVISAINSNCTEFEKAQGMLNPVQKSKAWNDKKVDAHHAIIPTAKTSDLGRLGKAERQIYELVARQYLYQFLPAYRYFETKVEVMIEGGRFTTTARQPLEQGWKILLGKQTPDKDDAEQQTLPALTQGQNLHSERGEVVEKITQPPKYFTDATLLAAMTGISRYVTDSDIRKVLKDTDGLGTEATRAGIIELLFKRGFLTREGKAIRATEAGGGLVDALPDSASKPDMTAHWESQLDAISQKHASYQSFMSPLLGRLNELIAQAVTVVPSSLQGLPSKPVKRRRKRSAGTGTRSRKATSSKRKQLA